MLLTDRAYSLIKGWIESGLSLKDCYDRLIEDGLDSDDAWEALDQAIYLIRGDHNV